MKEYHNNISLKKTFNLLMQARQKLCLQKIHFLHSWCVFFDSISLFYLEGFNQTLTNAIRIQKNLMVRRGRKYIQLNRKLHFIQNIVLIGIFQWVKHKLNHLKHQKFLVMSLKLLLELFLLMADLLNSTKYLNQF